MKWLIRWIEGLFRRQGIKTYAGELGPLLEKRYGRRKTYNAEQIRKSSEDGRLPPAYICYGFALFLDRADFDRVQKERGEDSIAELCRQEGIAQGMYYTWSKEFLEAGKKRLAGDTARAANTGEVKDLRREAQDLKEVVAEQALELRLLKKSMIGDGEDIE